MFKKATKRAMTAMVIIVILLLHAVVANATPLQFKVPEQQDGQVFGCQIWLPEDTKATTPEGVEITLKGGSRGIALADVGSSTFLIELEDGKRAYVDNTYLLINIKQYIPSLIVNLQMAKERNSFTMADEVIPNLTDKQFYQSEGAKNGSEAWLRYEPAKKLLEAQKNFLEDGFCIVIYDAYRPKSASEAFKEAYSAFINSKPNPVEFKKIWFGGLKESYFLAQTASSHNFGKAIDMGLRNIETGEMLEMPTNIHTLDVRSAQVSWKVGSEAYNNACYLNTMMKKVGFSDLISEWWHFQDNSIPNGNAIDLDL